MNFPFKKEPSPVAFDLTSEKGVEEASGFMKTFEQWGWAFMPIQWGLYKLLSPEKASSAQAETARGLIETGRQNGVRKMTIAMDHKAGLELAGNVDGVNVKAMVGNEGKVIVNVEYK